MMYFVYVENYNDENNNCFMEHLSCARQGAYHQTCFCRVALLKAYSGSTIIYSLQFRETET